MSIRVIAGSARGRQLKLVPGDSTRPIMDRVKESLFNIIGVDIVGAAFLDLFAGTGSVGIEALSRGAARAVFVELDALAVKTVQQNLALTRLADRAQVRRADAFAVLSAAPEAEFDYVYVAPPQYQGMWLRALRLLDDNPAWTPHTVVAQIDPKEAEPAAFQRLVETDRRQYGKTLLIFYEGRE